MLPGRHPPYSFYRKSKNDRLSERRKEMSIKKNMKRRILMAVALAMTLAVLAASTAHAAAPSKKYPLTMTNTASDPSVVVGEPVTFHLAVTNHEPNDLSPVQVTDYT
jgi:hypothetical protein